MNQQHSPVSLGCGTLILIAVIVSIFSNSGSEVEDDIRRLRNDVQQLTQEVQDLKQLIKTAPALQAEAN